MSMTREEAIKHLTAWIYTDFDNMPKQVLEALNISLSALRPVSREQVEKVFPWCKHCTEQKVSFCYDGANDSVYLLTGNGLAAIESDSWGFLVSYCPHCGRPLTDEAVQMVMERLEALYEAD